MKRRLKSELQNSNYDVLRHELAASVLQEHLIADITSLILVGYLRAPTLVVTGGGCGSSLSVQNHICYFYDCLTNKWSAGGEYPLSTPEMTYGRPVLLFGDQLVMFGQHDCHTIKLSTAQQEHKQKQKQKQEPDEDTIQWSLAHYMPTPPPSIVCLQIVTIPELDGNLFAFRAEQPNCVMKLERKKLEHWVEAGAFPITRCEGSVTLAKVATFVYGAGFTKETVYRLEPATVKFFEYDCVLEKCHIIPWHAVENQHRLFATYVGIEHTDSVLICGGQNTLIGSVMAECTIFNTKTRQWTDAPSMRCARWGCAGVAIDDRRVVVMGGMASNVMDVPNKVATVELFDATLNTWTLLAPMPKALYFPSCLVIYSSVS